MEAGGVDPPNAMAMVLVFAGMEQVPQGNFVGARRALDFAVNSGDGSAVAWAHYGLGLLEEKQGRYQDARRHYREGIRSGHPDAGPWARWGLGMLERDHGDRAEAKIQLRCAVDTGEAVAAPRAACALAVLLEWEGDVDGARQLYAIARTFTDGESLASARSAVERLDAGRRLPDGVHPGGRGAQTTAVAPRLTRSTAGPEPIGSADAARPLPRPHRWRSDVSLWEVVSPAAVGLGLFVIIVGAVAGWFTGSAISDLNVFVGTVVNVLTIVLAGLLSKRFPVSPRLAVVWLFAVGFGTVGTFATSYWKMIHHADGVVPAVLVAAFVAAVGLGLALQASRANARKLVEEYRSRLNIDDDRDEYDRRRGI